MAESEEFVDGDIRLWIEQGSSIHLKAVSPFGDPVEITAEDARDLAAKLLMLAKAIE